MLSEPRRAMTMPRRKRRILLSEAEEQRRRETYEQTDSDGEAALRLDMNAHTFRVWRENRYLPKKDSTSRKLTATQIESIQADYMAGRGTQAQIAERHGGYIGTVGRYCREMQRRPR
jgi:DNA-binding CsgD family transcriptional regulator